MRKLYIDTNIIIDLLSHREPSYEESANLFSLYFSTTPHTDGH